MGLLVAIIIVGFVIFIHELGHFIFAKLWHVSVLQFAIGWGPKIISVKKRETQYRLNLFPLIGGYVKLLGEEGDNSDEKDLDESSKWNLKRLDEIAPLKKASVFGGGVLLQFLICILILSLVVVFAGKPSSIVLVANVMENSPAFISGIKSGDLILKANENKIISSKALIEFISRNADREILLQIKRKEAVLKIAVIPRFNPKENRAQIGVGIAETTVFSKEGMRLYEYVFGGAILTFKIAFKVMEGICSLILRRVSLKALIGPIGIVDLTGEVAKTGFLYTLLFFAIININLAIINAFPIPACDGAHLLMLSVESIFKIRISPRFKRVINIAGFALLILLLFYVSYNDLLNLQHKYLLKH
ncbi:MAG: PDZ domain-containing protein [Candidatus Omnitrophica bacterium]|nr:PDZ domain-containing protein [Candidatus Omnitrophota bacterium]